MKEIALDELGIRNKFITLKDKFSKPPSRSGSIGIRSPKFDSNSSQISQKHCKKPFVKSKSSTHTNFFHKRHDSNPPQTQRQVPEPKITDRGLFSKRRSQEDLMAINPIFKNGKMENNFVMHHSTKGANQKKNSNAEGIVIPNRMIERPLVQNMNHIIPSSRLIIDSQNHSIKKFKVNTQRDAPLQDTKRNSQERIETMQLVEPGHRKNIKSLKFNSGTIKAMLVEKLHKRYDLNKQLSNRRTIDKIEGVASQKHFKTTTQKIYDAKAAIGLQKKIKRRSQIM